MTRANQLQRLRAAVVEDDDYKKGNVHQAILSVTLGSCIQRELGYGEAITWTQEQYGDAAVFAVLVGKAHYYILNDGFARLAEDCPLHRKLLRLFRRSPLKETPLGQRYYAILASFDGRKTDYSDIDHLYGEECREWETQMNEFFQGVITSIPGIDKPNEDTEESDATEEVQRTMFDEVMVNT